MSLARSSVVVAGFSATGILLNFVATAVTAAAFGASRAMDGYLAAAAIPTYIVAILTGALGITFIPVFAEHRHRDPVLAWRTVSAVLNFAVVGSLAIVGLGMAFALPILRVSAPGFTAEEQAYAAVLLRTYLPVVLVSVVNELLASIYYAHHHFAVPLLNKVIAPTITILAVLLLGSRISVMALVVATLAGSVIQCCILAVGVARRPDFPLVPTREFDTPELRKVLKLMLPLVCGMLIYKIVPVFDRFVLSSLPAGSIANVNYAVKLQGAVVQILSASVVLPVFPILSTLAAEGNRDALKATIARVIRLTFFMAVPVAALFGVFGEPLVRLTFERGAFLPTDTRAVFLCCAVYMASLPVVAIGGVVSQGLYVLQDTRTVAIVGVFETVLYISLCSMLLQRFEYLAPPIAYGIYFTVSVVALGVMFRRRLGLGGGWDLAKTCGVYVLLGLGLGLMGLLLREALSPTQAWSIVWYAALTMVYFLAARAIGSREATLLWEKAHGVALRIRP